MGKGMEKAGGVVKSLSPGAPGTKQWQERYGDRLVRVRYRANRKRRVRSTTVEIIVEEAYWTRKATKCTSWLCSIVDIPYNH